MSHSGTELFGVGGNGGICRIVLLSRARQLLRGVQMFGALLWVIYGLLIRASPVIVANVLVFSAAAWTTFRKIAQSDLSASQRVSGRPD